MLKCYQKPNRSSARVYSREDAARIVCRVLLAVEGEAPQAVGSGFSVARGQVALAFKGVSATFDRDLADILERVEKRCGRKQQFRRPGLEEAIAAEAKAGQEAETPEAVSPELGAEGALEVAKKELDQSRIVWINLLEFFAALIGVLTAVAAVARFIPVPPVRLAAVGLSFAIRRIAAFQGTIIARAAANDAAFANVQRALEILRRAA